MQNISTENPALSEDAPPLAARPDDLQNESQAAKRAADEASAPVAPKGHKKKKKIKHVLRMEHQTLGRVRMKFSSAKGNPQLLDEIGKKFAGIVGVESCEVNPITGSVVLLIRQAAAQRFPRSSEPPLRGAPWRRDAAPAGHATRRYHQEDRGRGRISRRALPRRQKRRAHLQICRSSHQTGDGQHD